MRRAPWVAALLAVATAIGLVVLRSGGERPRPKPVVASATAEAPLPEPEPAPLPPAVVAAPVRAEPEKPESEDAYLRELMRLRSADPARALALARKGDDWYPSVGRAAEARKAMVVSLLVDLGNMEEARELTRRFIAAYPSSEYRPLVQGVTGIHPRPHGPDGVEY